MELQSQIKRVALDESDKRQFTPHHNRNVSLDSSLQKSNNLTIPLSSDSTSNVTVISPGAHSLCGAAEELVAVSSIISSSSISRGSGSSRGSSPASKKKLISESSSGASGSRRRSPLAPRKNPSVSESPPVTSTTSPQLGAQTGSANQTANLLEDDIGDEIELLQESRIAPSLNGESPLQSCPAPPDASSTPHRGSSDTDDLDGSTLPPASLQQRTAQRLEKLQAKIVRTTELIKDEQRVRDDNVNEYLKLSANADRQQLPRIKMVFEKKNQKSAAAIQHLQKKLDSYQRQRKDLEQHGIAATSLHRQPKEVFTKVGHGFRSVGDNIRDGISGFSGKKALIGKPKDLAHLIKNKFGSADNIKELSGGADGAENDKEEGHHHGSATLPPNSGLHPTSSSVVLSKPAPSSGTVGSSGVGGGGGSSGGGGKACSEDGGSECNSSVTSESVSGGIAGGAMPLVSSSFASPHNHHGLSSFDVAMGPSFLEPVMQELKDRQEENARLRDEIDMIKQTLSGEVSHLYDSLLEEKIRYERLEEQVNDLTELHQNEMENVKTTVKDLANMEEKVQYKNEESLRDLHELVDECQTKITKMEHQQAQQQAQFLTLEGLENTNARNLVVKLINILLTVLQVILLVVATLAGIVTPLLQTKRRLAASAFVAVFLIFAYVQLADIRRAWAMLRHGSGAPASVS